MCNLVGRAPQNLEKAAKNPMEKISSNPVTSVAVTVFSALIQSYSDRSFLEWARSNVVDAQSGRNWLSLFLGTICGLSCNGQALDRVTKQRSRPNMQTLSRKKSKNCFQPLRTIFGHFPDNFSTFPFSGLSNDLPVTRFVPWRKPQNKELAKFFFS